MTFTGDTQRSEGASTSAAADEPVSPAVEDFRGAPRPGDTLRIGFAGTRYELVRSLGIGGYAEVFLARQLGPEGFVHEVALKCTLHGLDRSASARREFLCEARLASRLRHPNIAAALDLAVSDDRYYLVLEYVDGLTARAALLAAREAEKRLGWTVDSSFEATGPLQGRFHVTLRDRDGRPLEAGLTVTAERLTRLAQILPVTMAEAAPGRAPQTAVVPGNSRHLASSQPNTPLAAITEKAAARNSGQSRAISCRIAGVIFCAIMPPIAACAIRKALVET
jgi:hypothetical protein